MYFIDFPDDCTDLNLRVSRNVFFLSTFYTRHEIASRIGIFYAGSVFASAFGGLLAYGVFHIKGNSTYFTWSYLFILEGCCTVLVAFIQFFILPKGIRKAYFLSEAEKQVAEDRLLVASLDSLNPEFIWSEAVREFKT